MPNKRTVSPIPITPISSVNANRKSNFGSNSNSNSNNGSNSQLIIGSGISSVSSSITGTPGSNLQQNSNKIGFNRTSSEKDNKIYQQNNSNMDSMSNSRGDSRSKRKIFAKA